MTTPMTRRAMLAGTACGAAALMASQPAAGLEPASQEPPAPIQLKPGTTVLFQGDSITHGKRKGSAKDKVNNFDMLGTGYVNMIASALLTRHAELELRTFNRGVPGHKIPQLDNRWDRDCIDLKPDVLSIMIGVNDIWHMKRKTYKGTIESYAAGYKALLKRTRDALPDIQLVICEPFVTRTGVVQDNWFPDFDAYRAAAKAAADEFKAVFVPFHSMFEKAVELNGDPAYWAYDGVHPTSHGDALMSSRWLSETGLA